MAGLCGQMCDANHGQTNPPPQREAQRALRDSSWPAIMAAAVPLHRARRTPFTAALSAKGPINLQKTQAIAHSVSKQSQNA